MKTFVAAIAFLILTGTVNAKIACAPDVNQTMCKDGAKLLDSFFDHGIMRGVDIPVEVVTAKEYAKRLSDMEDDEARSANLYPGGLNAIADCKTCFSPLRKHILANLEDHNVSFIRDDPRFGLVDRILISSEYLEGFTLALQGGGKQKVNGGAGIYNPRAWFDLRLFVSGYICGTMSQLNDNTLSEEFTQKHFPKQSSK